MSIPGSDAGFLSSTRTIRRGDALARGTEKAYHRLAYGPGEPRIRRLDFVPDPPAVTRRETLLHFVHLTDMHILDPQSAGRFEMIERLQGPEPLHLILPAYRPQEVLHVHACNAMIRTVNRIEGSPETGAPVQFVFCGGDNTDNAELNELQMFFDLMSGTCMSGNTGGPKYEGVECRDWGDPSYWLPDGESDDYKSRWGFPAYPGILDETIRPFRSDGCRFPWLSAYGNHDSLIIGAGLRTPEYQEIVVGGRKAHALPHGFDPLDHLGVFIMRPQFFLSGPSREVTPDARRRVIGRHEFLAAHLHAGGRPVGHGFTLDNVDQDRAYYVRDEYPGVRLIVLDTTNPGGHYLGSIGAGQLSWLEQRLTEVHSRYYDANGNLVETDHADRLVVVCSHHDLDTLTNPLIAHGAPVPDEDDLPRYRRDEVEGLLHRFPNVILLVNGHTHRNRVSPRYNPTRKTAGFWEITTSSLIDWPLQGRLVELVSNSNGTLSIFSTLIDNDAPLDPRETAGLDRLVAIHRELAANDPLAGMDHGKGGRPEDRTVELVLPAPLPARPGSCG